MSSMSYDFTRSRMNFEAEANTFNSPVKEYTFEDEFCIGQDAGYILRKRAMIVDLWNLVPETTEKSSSLDTALFFDLPVTYHTAMEGSLQSAQSTQSFDKQIPIQ